jgi:arylsulfatase A-like enzyme
MKLSYLISFVILFVNGTITRVFAQKSSPNIVWLTFEDTSPHFVGCYGNKAAKTPFMDSLSKVGVRFTKAFSTGSVCSPSRSALITGMKTYTLGTGHHRSQYKIPEFVKGFPFYLKKAGYYCSNNEKTDYNVANPKEFIAETWDESSTKAGWWNRKDGQPFFAVFNSAASHQSRTMTNSHEEYENMVLKKLPSHLQVSEKEMVMPPFYRESPEMRKNLSRIYNSIALADYEMKQIFDRLKQEKLLENTIVFCFADHGEGMPRVKTNGIGMGHQVPFFVYIPEKLRASMPFKANATNDQLLDFCDLPPTVLDLAGVDIPQYFQGKSIIKNQHEQLFVSTDRSDESTDLVRTIITKKYAYTRVFMPFMPELRYLKYVDQGDITAQIRKDFRENKLNKTQQSILTPRAIEYLFDYEKDPWQINNLALLPENEAILKKFRTQLQKHIASERDVMFLPEGDFKKIAKSSSLYDYRLDDANYPIDQIINIAMLSGQSSSLSCKQQITALTHPNETVKYWAAMGLKSQSVENLTKNKKEIALSMTQANPTVKAVLASVLSDKLGDKNATQLLNEIILGNDDHAAYLALQCILYQQNKADFEQTATDFLAKRKGQKEYANAKSTAQMLLYTLEKLKMDEIKE